MPVNVNSEPLFPYAQHNRWVPRPKHGTETYRGGHLVVSPAVYLLEQRHGGVVAVSLARLDYRINHMRIYRTEHQPLIRYRKVYVMRPRGLQKRVSSLVNIAVVIVYAAAKLVISRTVYAGRIAQLECSSAKHGR